jgi:hypothetical protein
VVRAPVDPIDHQRQVLAKLVDRCLSMTRPTIGVAGAAS